MHYAYSLQGGRLVRNDADRDLADAAWIDLIQPGDAEMARLRDLDVPVPSLAEMEEIELSNRLYREDGMDYMTVMLPGERAGGDRTSMPVTFILSADRLVTVRHHSPRPFLTYPDRAAPALDAVSLSVRPGEVVAVTGPSGCGKSTLIAVLLGFVGVDSGRVTVCGSDLGRLDLDQWRRQVAWVPQRPYLLATTLADNIRLGRPDAPDADVLRAAHDAGLGRLVDRLPEGLATPLGERGAGLSAGGLSRRSSSPITKPNSACRQVAWASARGLPHNTGKSAAAGWARSSSIVAGQVAKHSARPAIGPHAARAPGRLGATLA